MKLVPADEIDNEDRYVQYHLDRNHVVKCWVALLLNGYRELVQLCMEEDATDPSDIVRSRDKWDTVAKRLGLPLFTSLQDWTRVREYLKSQQSGVEEAWVEIERFQTFQQEMQEAISRIGTIEDDELQGEGV